MIFYKFLFSVLLLTTLATRLVGAQATYVSDPVVFKQSRFLKVDEFGVPDIKSLGLFANDTFWDGQDRWRSGSYQRSWVLNDEYEFRIRSEYISPSNLTNPDELNDRPYASILNLGWFGRYGRDDTELRAGATLDVINEISLMADFHSWLHGKTGYSGYGVDDFQVDPAFKPSVEASWRYEKNFEFGYLVPFVEAQWGTRNRVTTGIDLILTDRAYDWVARDQTTGNLLGFTDYSRGNENGLDWMLGGDVSYVSYDYFLQNSKSNVATENLRYRFRFGFRYHNNGATMFVGPTYLSPEFVGGGSQFLQTTSIEMNF